MALRQRRYDPLPDWKQALLIFAVSEGFASSVPVEEMEKFETALYEYFEKERGDIAQTLATGKRMDRAFAEELKKALKEFSEGM